MLDDTSAVQHAQVSTAWKRTRERESGRVKSETERGRVRARERERERVDGRERERARKKATSGVKRCLVCDVILCVCAREHAAFVPCYTITNAPLRTELCTTVL